MEYKVIAFSRFPPPPEDCICIPSIIAHIKDGIPVKYSINTPEGRVITKVFLESGLDEGSIQRTICRPPYESEHSAYLDLNGTVRYATQQEP